MAFFPPFRVKSGFFCTTFEKLQNLALTFCILFISFHFLTIA